MDTVRACSPSPGLYTAPTACRRVRAAIRAPEASIAALRHCEGPLPSTLGLWLLASDETDEGKVFVKGGRVFVEGRVFEDDKVLPLDTALFPPPSPPPWLYSPSSLAYSSCTLPPPPFVFSPVADEGGGCASHRYPPSPSLRSSPITPPRRPRCNTVHEIEVF